MLLNERVNTLDSNKRYVNETLTEITNDSKHHQIRMSDEELEKVKIWGGLGEDHSFLGGGSMGSAYQFGDRVLKLTGDTAEAQACNLIKGKNHPNVYSILAVAQRNPEDINSYSAIDERTRHQRYIIIYELLDYPLNEMVESTADLYPKLIQGDAQRNTGEKSIYYNWDEGYYNMAREIFANMATSIRPEAFEFTGDAAKKYGGHMPKFMQILEKSNISWPIDSELAFKELLNFAYIRFADSRYEEERKQDPKYANTPGLVGPGKIRNDFVEVEDFQNMMSQMINSAGMGYFNQLCLGLTFLKNNNIIYNDLRTSNIMEKNDQVAIIDIGKGRFLGGNTGELEVLP